MPAFWFQGTYGPYEDDRWQKPTIAEEHLFYDRDDAYEAAHEWSMSDPTCRSRVVPVPLCNDDCGQ